MGKIFEGVGCALITPMNKDESINYDAFIELLKNVNNDVNAVFVHGTTGEGSSLTDDEKVELLNLCDEYLNSSIKIVASISENVTSKAIKEMRYLENWATRIDGHLVLTPFYNKCSQEGLRQHFSNILNATEKSVILYHVPSRTNVDITIETMRELKKFKNLAGIKYADRELLMISQLSNEFKDEDFGIYCGDDDLFLPMLENGAHGVISAAANVYHQEFKEIYEQFVQTKNSPTFFENLTKYQGLYKDVNPIGVKYLFCLKNNFDANYRLPLCQPSEEYKAYLGSL